MFTCYRRKSARVAVLGLLVAAVARVALAAPAFSRSFDGPDLVWQVLDNHVPSQVLAHDILAGGARNNQGMERIVIAAGAGQTVLLACPTTPIAAIDELQVRLWVRANRPNIQLAARFTLPHSLDLRTHMAASAIVRGAVYSRPNHWQELVLDDVPKRLAEQVRVLRTIPGATIDSREAYLDAAILLVPGDPQGLEIGTDQLDVDGIPVNPVADARPVAHRGGGKKAAARTGWLAGDPLPQPQPNGFENGHTSIDDHTSPARLQGPTLFVEGKAFLPRVIQWNGEPLQFLSDLGFNTVQLATLPSAEQIAEAKRSDMWFLCTPPRPEALRAVISARLAIEFSLGIWMMKRWKRIRITRCDGPRRFAIAMRFTAGRSLFRPILIGAARTKRPTCCSPVIRALAC